MLLRPAAGLLLGRPGRTSAEPGGGGISKGGIVFGASPVTRTELGSDGRTVTWHADDRINVYMLPEGSGSPVYAPYSIQAGSIGDDGRTALFEGGLSWQSPASTHTFYAYYAGAASGIELDGTTGQNALVQAREFAQVMDLTGIILTKMDGTAKGGIAVAIQSELHVPVKYIGVGEKIEDLQKFDPDQFVNALFDTEKDEVY